MHPIRLGIFCVMASSYLLQGTPHAYGQDVWYEARKFLPNDGSVYDFFGQAVGISGTTGIVGTHYDDTNGRYAGAAYLIDTSTNTQIAKLLAEDGSTGDYFGYSVSISETVCIVGAYSDSDNGNVSGSAYLFDTRTAMQSAKLLPADGERGDRFGYSVATEEDVCVVGAPYDGDNAYQSGSAYLFETGTGRQRAKLLATDGATMDYFGHSAAISGTACLVGAPEDEDNGNNSGSAYLFDTRTGTQIAKLLPEDGATYDNFGYSVAISGTICIVGAYGDDVVGRSSGSAYLFDTSTGTQIAKLLPQDGAADDYFGLSVAISGTTAIVGAKHNDDFAKNSGSAYLFDTSTGTQIAKLLPSDGAIRDRFGHAVAISGTTYLVTAPDDDDYGEKSGSAYIFHPVVPCLQLSIDNLVAGEVATFTITNGTPGVNAVVVCGRKPGSSIVSGFSGYCATFGIGDLTMTNIIGGLDLQFDANGEIVFEQRIAPRASGRYFYVQAAMQGTCPDACVSNLLRLTVQ